MLKASARASVKRPPRISLFGVGIGRGGGSVVGSEG